jgi:hypothetical protein
MPNFHNEKRIGNEYAFARSLTDSLAREQITALSDFGDGLMRPDKCGEFEPLSTPFDPGNII